MNIFKHGLEVFKDVPSAVVQISKAGDNMSRMQDELDSLVSDCESAGTDKIIGCILWVQRSLSSDLIKSSADKYSNREVKVKITRTEEEFSSALNDFNL